MPSCDALVEHVAKKIKICGTDSEDDITLAVLQRGSIFLLSTRRRTTDKKKKTRFHFPLVPKDAEQGFLWQVTFEVLDGGLIDANGLWDILLKKEFMTRAFGEELVEMTICKVPGEVKMVVRFLKTPKSEMEVQASLAYGVTWDHPNTVASAVLDEYYNVEASADPYELRLTAQLAGLGCPQPEDEHSLVCGMMRSMPAFRGEGVQVAKMLN